MTPTDYSMSPCCIPQNTSMSIAFSEIRNREQAGNYVAYPSPSHKSRPYQTSFAVPAVGTLCIVDAYPSLERECCIYTSKNLYVQYFIQLTSHFLRTIRK